MRTMLPVWKKWGPLRLRQGMVWCLATLVFLPMTARAQPQSPAKGVQPAQKDAGDSKGKDEDATKSGRDARASKSEAGKGDAKSDVAPMDPSQTRRIARNEIFRDPKAEKLLDITKFQRIGQKVVLNTDILQLNAYAGGADPNTDKNLVEAVVDAMVTKLTDHANIQALIEPPDKPSPNSPTYRAIQEATTTLLQPLFLARNANPKNTEFLNLYNRLLILKLTPLLRNHLVPRVQAMIILGESGSLEMLPLYEAQIKDPNQTVWVKLWALEGIVNITEQGRHLTGQAEVDAAKIVSDFLANEEETPWPVQLRALEVLSALRKGFEPNRPRNASMANTAMKLMTDEQSNLDVRSEAARALGFMEISSAVPRYNYALIAHAAGQLAAELGARLSALVVTKPGTGPAAATKKGAGARTGGARKATAAEVRYVSHEEKAHYYIALLVGPVYQTFDGAPGIRDSGLLHATIAGDAAAYIGKVFELVKAVAKASVELNISGSRQLPDREKELAAAVKALREFLAANAPRTRRLVQDGVEYPIAGAPAPTTAEDVPAAKPARASTSGKARGKRS